MHVGPQMFLHSRTNTDFCLKVCSTNFVLRVLMGFPHCYISIRQRARRPREWEGQAHRVGAVRLRRWADVGRSPGPERSGRGRISGGSRQQGVGNRARTHGGMAAAGGQEDMRGEDGEVYHRDNIFEFFRNHTAYDMLPESGKVRPRSVHAPGPLRPTAVCVRI